MGCRAEGNKGEEKKWDNCNSIINKIYFKKLKAFQKIMSRVPKGKSHTEENISKTSVVYHKGLNPL